MDSRETIKVKKMVFVKSSLNEKSPSASWFLTEWTVMKIEANVRYLVKVRISLVSKRSIVEGLLTP